MFFKKLEEIANDTKLKASEKSVNQTQRNVLVNEITKSLYEMLSQGKTNENDVIRCSDFVEFGMTDSKTIEFAIDNESVGIIPLKISVSIPNFDLVFTLDDKIEEYKRSIKEKNNKKEEKERLKQEKIKADQERRAKALALKEQNQADQ